MIEHIINFPEFVMFLSAAVIFIIVFLVIKDVLKEFSIFKGKTSIIMAVCVSLLGIIGLYRFFVVTDGNSQPSENSDRTANIDFILLPYVVLIISILFCLLLKYIGKIFPGYRENRHSKELKREIEDKKNDPLKNAQDLSKSAPPQDQHLSQITRNDRLR